jgi:hypothetical protein
MERGSMPQICGVLLLNGNGERAERALRGFPEEFSERCLTSLFFRAMMDAGFF